MNEGTEIPVQRCSRCGYKFDATSEAFGDAKPVEGDVSMCIACGALAIFNSDLTLREPTEEDRAKLERDERIIAAQMARSYTVGDELKGKNN